MQNILIFFLFALGLSMIIKGSDWFVDSVIWISSVFKIPQIIVGATIVSICTTLPETLVSVTAAFNNDTEFAFGNSIGSVSSNTGFILAILIIFSMPIIENKKPFLKNSIFLLALLVFIFISGITVGEINLYMGLVLVGLLILYLIDNVRSAKKSLTPGLKYDLEDEEDMEGEIPLYEGAALDLKDNEIDISRKVAINYIIFFVTGISLVVGGSNLLVNNGIKIAELLGVPSILIAVTFVSVGTSLPELVTTISSIRKKASNLGVGNIIGSNILNIIQVLSFSSIIKSIPLNNPKILYVQLPLTMLSVTLAVIYGFLNKPVFKRFTGILLLFVYALFIVLNIL